jgi:hypothetical protein
MRAAALPTWPKPCTTMRAPCIERPISRHASSRQVTTPRPVASRRPYEPPISIGFPVTTPGTLWPFCCE